MKLFIFGLLAFTSTSVISGVNVTSPAEALNFTFKVKELIREVSNALTTEKDIKKACNSLGKLEVVLSEVNIQETFVNSSSLELRVQGLKNFVEESSKDKGMCTSKSAASPEKVAKHLEGKADDIYLLEFANVDI